MTPTAFQFPGQGSQYVGMGRPFHDASALARDLFPAADDILRFRLTSLCFTGPDAELRRTENAQSALEFERRSVRWTPCSSRDYEPAHDFVPGHFERRYADRERLVLLRIENYHRRYDLSGDRT